MKVSTIMFLSVLLAPKEKNRERARGLTQEVRSPSRQAESNLASDAIPIQRGSKGWRVHKSADLGS